MERHVQTIVKAVSTVMNVQILLNATFWDYGLFHTIMLKNHSPNSKTNGLIPEAMVTASNSVDLRQEFLFSFGAPVAARVPKREWRFDIKNELGVYLGDSGGSVNGGLVYYPSTRAIVARGDLKALTIQPENFKRYSNIRDDLKTSAASSAVNTNILRFPDECNQPLLPVLNNDGTPPSTEYTKEPQVLNNEVTPSSTAKCLNQLMLNETRNPSIKSKMHQVSNRQLKQMLK